MSKRLDAIKDRKRQSQLEDDVESARAQFCANCCERVSDDSSAWVRKIAVAPDDEAEEVWYCDRCIKVDETRQFKGRRPPSMEQFPQ